MKTVHDTAKALAIELETTTGDSWIVAPGPRGHNAGDGLSRWTSIVRGDGLALTIRTTSGKPEIRISQSIRNEKWVDSDGENVDPRGYLPDGEREAFPSIGVAASKSIPTIARDVRKRVLPEAEAFHATALDRVRSSNEHNAKRDAFGAAMGCDGTNSNGYRTRRIYRSEAVDGVGTVEIECASFGIKIEIADLSTKRALAVLKALGIKVAK